MKTFNASAEKYLGGIINSSNFGIWDSIKYCIESFHLDLQKDEWEFKKNIIETFEREVLNGASGKNKYSVAMRENLQSFFRERILPVINAEIVSKVYTHMHQAPISLEEYLEDLQDYSDYVIHYTEEIWDVIKDQISVEDNWMIKNTVSANFQTIKTAAKKQASPAPSSSLNP